MRARRGCALMLTLTMSSGVVMAQPGAAPPGPVTPPPVASPPNAPPPLPPASNVWHRFRLTDGRELDALVVGGDQASYYVQTAQGTFSVARTMVISMVPIPSAAPPSPLSIAPPAPPIEQKRSRAAGFLMFGLTYGLTVVVARARKDGGPDSDATFGYIPVIGPLVWSATDQDSWGSDGWDWIALFVSLCQGIGAYGMIAGLEDPPPSQKKRGLFGVNPVHTNEMSGFAVSGRF